MALSGLSMDPVSKMDYAMHKIKSIHHKESIDSKQMVSYNTEPVIRFVDQLIYDAIEKKISDIHIEPYEHQCRIRFRKNGLLYESAYVPIALATQIILRVKVMAHLNIAEKRLPLDGRIQLCSTSKVFIRVSTCPTLYGEKIVLRIQNTQTSHFNLNNLGMTPEQSQLFIEKISQSQGLILVTGPTGSGKSMTLYSALHFLNDAQKNISTVEDPIEIELAGINQINVNPTIGLDFSTTLRALLRQDPDVIMLGEIRDMETATIALQAAQTGHLVLATLHANSTSDALTRLYSLGITNNHLMKSISLIIGQRLLRTLCQVCKQSDNRANQLGCQHCHNGYTGRTAIFELHMLENDRINKQLNLWDHGIEKVRKGITSDAEVRRVLTK